MTGRQRFGRIAIFAYVVDGSEGLRVIDVSDPANPVEVGSVDMPDLAGDVSVVGGLAYMTSGDAGLLVIDVSNPTTPAVVGSIDTPSYARGLSVAGGVAYVADSKSGVRVVPEPGSLLSALVALATVGVLGRYNGRAERRRSKSHRP